MSDVGCQMSDNCSSISAELMGNHSVVPSHESRVTSHGGRVYRAQPGRRAANDVNGTAEPHEGLDRRDEASLLMPDDTRNLRAPTLSLRKPLAGRAI
jgi:hypothetical protein